MMQVQFTVPGQPQAKGRPRFRVVTPKGKPSFVSTYTPPETVQNEDRIAIFAKRAMGGAAPSTSPVEVRIELHMQVPASWTKKKTAAALAGAVRATKKPDMDNCAKSLLDACNGICWADDVQVVLLSVRKLYSAEPRAVMAIRDVEGEAA